MKIKIKKKMTNMLKYKFLFKQLVKRDFQHKYKRTALGMVWSVLSPLLTLLVMSLVFTRFFGKTTPHYIIYMFSGTIVLAYYKEATKAGMTSLLNNSSIITKINIPKYLFLFSRNVSAFINFLLTLSVYFVFCIIDHISFGPHVFALIFPIICLTLMNVGIGMILSCWYIFFRDTTYLYDVFLTLLNYVSAIFYTIDKYSVTVQKFFLLNPVYVIIKYFRIVMIDGHLPSLLYHALILFYSIIYLFIGFSMYKKYNHEFIYYL